jgi:hypothetical protein
MAASLSPDKRMLVGIPVGRGRLDRFLNLLPGLKALAFESQRTQDLPPGFDEIEIGCIRRLIDKLRAWMMDHEEQQISAVMHLQIVHDGIDTLCVCWDLLVHVAEEVHKMHGAAARVALRPAVSAGLPQRSIDIAKGSAPIIDLLFSALGWTGVHLDRLLAGIARGFDGSHLIDI